MIKYNKLKFGLLLALSLVLILVSISLLSNSSQGKKSLFPPKENQEIVLEPVQVIYLKDSPTNYSLGAIGSEFLFTENELVVKEGEEKKNFRISYDKTIITPDEFQEEVQMGESLPDLASYKSILRYDLCKSTRDLPGYRLYILNGDTYWMATLYNNSIWRILAMEDSYWTN